MASNKSNGKKPPASVVPSWINEENFTELIQKQVLGFKKIQTFDAGLCGGAGENYASTILRIKATVELQGGSTKDVSYMIKTVPQTPEAGAMVTMAGLFPKELAVYTDLIPDFEHMYKMTGKNVTFGPKSLRLANDPGSEYILLEDLGLLGFKNENRLEGFDQEHTESVIKLLAEFHAASAVRYATKGAYDQTFMAEMIDDKAAIIFENVFKSMNEISKECMLKSPIGARYKDQVALVHSGPVFEKPDLSDFNVIIHGDFWANNIMFRHNNEGKLIESIFVDFQAARFRSPAVDLFYLLLSSTKLELKTAHFDEFIKYYHDHLVENLKLLHYPKEIPTLKQLHLDLLKYNYWAMHIVNCMLGPVLLEPNKDADMEKLMTSGAEAKQFQMLMYQTPRYIKHMEAVLPFLDVKGYLDF